MKTPCEFCHGITFDDARGHCSGCGAPRREKKRVVFEVETTAGTAGSAQARAVSIEEYTEILKGIPSSIMVTMGAGPVMYRGQRIAVDPNVRPQPNRNPEIITK